MTSYSVGQPPSVPGEGRIDRDPGLEVDATQDQPAVEGGVGGVADRQIVEMDPVLAAQAQPYPHVREPRGGGARIAARVEGGAGNARRLARDGQVPRRGPQRAQHLDAVQLADGVVRRGRGELGRGRMGEEDQTDQQASQGDGAGEGRVCRGSSHGGAKRRNGGAVASNNGDPART